MGLLTRLIEGSIRHTAQAGVSLSLKPFPRGEHEILRYAMYRRLSEVFAAAGAGPGRALSVSGSGYLAKLIHPGVEFTDASYPEASILSLPYADESFDYVVSDQVMEHVEGDPFLAIKESFRVLKRGGLAIHTSCLMMGVHAYPSDFWRFTPDAWRLLCKPYGEVLEAAGWGNRYLWLLWWLGTVSEYHVPEVAWHPYRRLALVNEETYPVSTWAVARKY